MGPNSQTTSNAQVDDGIYGTVLYTHELTILKKFLVVREMEGGIVEGSACRKILDGMSHLRALPEILILSLPVTN